MELLERLVPLVPRPRINLLLYHGVLAPNAPWRREVVARAEPEASAVEPCPPSPPADEQRAEAKPDRARPKYRAWADLSARPLRRASRLPSCFGAYTKGFLQLHHRASFTQLVLPGFCSRYRLHLGQTRGLGNRGVHPCEHFGQVNVGIVMLPPWWEPRAARLNLPILTIP